MRPPALQALALQAGFFAAVGLTAYALRRLAATPLHPRVAERGDLLRFPAMAATVSQLAALGDVARLDALLDKLCEIARLDAGGGSAAQWRISRLSAEVVRDADAMCVAAPTATSDEIYRAVLTCREEVVPMLRGQLDDLLHNHLLARQ